MPNLALLLVYFEGWHKFWKSPKFVEFNNKTWEFRSPSLDPWQQYSQGYFHRGENWKVESNVEKVFVQQHSFSKYFWYNRKSIVFSGRRSRLFPNNAPGKYVSTARICKSQIRWKTRIKDSEKVPIFTESQTSLQPRQRRAKAGTTSNN